MGSTGTGNNQGTASLPSSYDSVHTIASLSLAQMNTDEQKAYKVIQDGLDAAVSHLDGHDPAIGLAAAALLAYNQAHSQASKDLINAATSAILAGRVAATAAVTYTSMTPVQVALAAGRAATVAMATAIPYVTDSEVAEAAEDAAGYAWTHIANKDSWGKRGAGSRGCRDVCLALSQHL